MALVAVAATAAVDADADVEAHDRVGVIGKTGSGKSTKAKALVAKFMRKPGARCLALDPDDEWSQHGRKSEHVRLGPLRDRLTFAQYLDAVDVLQFDDLSLAVVPSGKPKERAREFAILAADLKDAGGDCLLVIEECHTFSRHAQEELDEVACTFRKFGVPVMFVTQRAIGIPKTARTQLSQIHSGRQDDPDDLDALAKVAGQDFAAQVSRLPRGQLLHWRDDFAGGAGERWSRWSPERGRPPSERRNHFALRPGPRPRARYKPLHGRATARRDFRKRVEAVGIEAPAKSIRYQLQGRLHRRKAVHAQAVPNVLASG